MKATSAGLRRLFEAEIATRATGRALGLAGAAVLLLASFPATAQDIVASSLATVRLPVPSVATLDDPTGGARRTNLQAEATALGTTCGNEEFHLWQPETEEASTNIYQQTLSAFNEAGWNLNQLQRNDAIISYAGMKGGQGLLMTWGYPADDLMMNLCLIPEAAAATAGAAEQDSSEDPADAALVSGGIALFGAFLIFWRIRRQRRRAAVAGWPEAVATILDHDIESVDVSDSDDHSSDYRYDPKVRYRYSAGGQDLEGNAIAIDQPRFMMSSKAEAYLLENFPLGRQVPVFYNPQKPTDALLVKPEAKRSVTWAVLHWVIIVAGAFLLLAGLAGLAGALLAG